MKKSTLVHIAFIFIALFIFTPIFGQQQINMQTGYFEQCSGGFLDSGGGGGAYQNNENFTLTICPDNPGDVIGIDFLTFTLDPTNTASGNNNNQDRLIIYDGNSTAAASMGTFTGNSLQGIFVSASPLNTSGCLTIRFISNDVGTGNWAGTITCETPCDRPTAVGTDNAPANRRICIGEEVTFDGSGSTAAPGFNIDTYLWDFGDGTTADSPVVTHSWNEPGEYLVELYLVDDNGCSSTNQISLQIMVETLPDWDPFVGDETICLGQTINWDIDPNEFEVTWIGAEPTVSVSIEDGLADVVGQCYEFPLVISGFGPGQTLDDVYSLLSIDLGIYHTFLFDLLIQITCPSGQTVVLHQQMQQPNGPDVWANGTDFGMPGNMECWNYSWTPQATQTISQIATQAGNDPLPVDDYMALQPLSDLVGCDLNGTWTISVCDLWGGDSGYLCDWGLSIDPSIIPDVTEFTTTIGQESDSSYWAGPSFGEVSADGNSISIVPDAVGEFEFTYTIINNHGCTHDSTVTITVVPGPEADAGDDLVICEDSLQLNGSVAGTPPPPPNCEYVLDMVDTFGDGWNGFSVTIIQDGIVVGTYTIPSGGTLNTVSIPLNHGSDIQINTSSGNWDSEVAYYLYNPAGEEVFSDEGTNTSGTPIQIGNNIWSGVVDCQPGTPDYVFEWSPVDGLSDPNIQNPMVMVNQNTTYTMTVWIDGSPECATTDEVEVTIPPEADPGQDNELTLCYNSPTFNLLDSLLGNPTDAGEWTDEGGNVVGSTFSPADHADGGTFSFTYTVTFGPCVKSAELIITVLEAGHEDCCQTSADAGPDGIACDLNWELSAGPVVGTGSWSGPPEVTFDNINDPNTTVTAQSPGGVIELFWTDSNGLLCEETDMVQVVFMDPVEVEFLTIPATCPDTCDAIVMAQPSGGLGEFTYNWNAGLAGATPDERISLCPGEVTVEIEDEYGCQTSLATQVTESPAPAINAINVTDVSCNGMCDGSIVISAPDAVSYSFDAGNTFGTSHMLDSLCAGSFGIEIRNELNCPNFQTVTVTEPPKLKAEFSMNPSPVDWTNTTVQFNNLSYPGPFTSTYWVFDTLNFLGTSTEQQPSFTFPNTDAGIYPVSLCVENEAGCTACTSYDLVVNKTLSLFVPNSFTPNEDGINDLFKAYLSTEHYSNYRMRIFNRYGELVYESNDPEVGWNGGEDSGTYYARDEVYVVEIQVTDDITNEVIEHTGHLTILR